MLHVSPTVVWCSGTKDKIIGLKRRSGDKRQIWLFKPQAMDEEAFRAMGQQCIDKLESGTSEDDTHALVQVQLTTD